MARYKRYRRKSPIGYIIIPLVLLSSVFDAETAAKILSIIMFALIVWIFNKIIKKIINTIKTTANKPSYKHNNFNNIKIAKANRILFNENDNIDANKTSGYESSKSIATETEKAFYKVLKQYCDERGYTINLKTRLEDLVEYAKGMDYATKQKYRGQIKSRHVDYLIVNQELKSLFAIELDDDSHLKSKAKETDKFKDEFFNKIGIKLYRVPADSFLWKVELEKIFINDDVYE